VATENQILANQLNSKKSTGPKTSEGKEAIKHNALTHGLLAQGSVLPGESEDLFRRLRVSLEEELEPSGTAEHLLVERVVDCFWRLQRASRVENGLFLLQIHAAEATKARREAQSYVSYPDDILSLEELAGRGKPHVSDVARHRAAFDRAQQADRAREGFVAAMGAAFASDASGPNAFTKLSRYETTIGRSLQRALADLRQMHADRRAGSGGLPFDT